MATLAADGSQPPGPQSPFPLLGVLPYFRKDPPGYLKSVAERYGDVVHLKLARQNAFLLSHPDDIREVLVTQQSKFVKSRILERARMLLGDGLLTSEGEFHTRQRRLVQPAFHRDRLIHYADEMAQCAVNARESWQPGEHDIWQEMTRLTLAIVGRTLFSTDVSSETQDIGEAMSDILAMFDTLLMPFIDLAIKLRLPQIRRFERAQKKLDRIVYGLIAERRASQKDYGDLLSMLLFARDEQDNARMTDQQVHDEALTLLLAGHETTANALAWCWYLLAQNPSVEMRFPEEINQVLGGRTPGFDDAPRLPYTTGVFSEALRLFPPAWAIGRRAVQDVRIRDYTIPAGSIFLMSSWVVHRDARWWAEPERFEPERWIEPDETRPKFAYFPFGSGARLCIGERFAWSEGVIVLAALAQRWRMKLVPGHSVEPTARITLRPKHGIRVILTARS